MFVWDLKRLAKKESNNSCFMGFSKVQDTSTSMLSFAFSAILTGKGLEKRNCFGEVEKAIPSHSSSRWGTPTSCLPYESELRFRFLPSSVMFLMSIKLMHAQLLPLPQHQNNRINSKRKDDTTFFQDSFLFCLYQQLQPWAFQKYMNNFAL